MLAHLAEADLLRHVEVLSCVSGGSIIGAYYYLEVRKLLNETPDREITRDDYMRSSSASSRSSSEAVQKTCVRGSLLRLSPTSERCVEPVTRGRPSSDVCSSSHIFARVAGRWPPNPRGHRPSRRRTRAFNPKLDNWRRAAKGPVLLLNATTLNTGHNWQFAVSWMGEPPLGASSPVDRNDVLRRHVLLGGARRVIRRSAGRAVAASACVPALFDPSR